MTRVAALAPLVHVRMLQARMHVHEQAVIYSDGLLAVGVHATTLRTLYALVARQCPLASCRRGRPTTACYVCTTRGASRLRTPGQSLSASPGASSNFKDLPQLKQIRQDVSSLRRRDARSGRARWACAMRCAARLRSRAPRVRRLRGQASSRAHMTHTYPASLRAGVHKHDARRRARYANGHGRPGGGRT